MCIAPFELVFELVGIPYLISNADREEQASAGAGGSVAHLSSFILKDKQTGLEKKESTVTLATVDLVDGRRVLKELTEVHRSA